MGGACVESTAGNRRDLITAKWDRGCIRRMNLLLGQLRVHPRRSAVLCLDLVRVAMPMVVMMSMRTDLFHLRRCRAAMCGLAPPRLELDRGMRDVEAVAQGAVDRVQNSAALRDRHLLDRYMAG